MAAKIRRLRANAGPETTGHAKGRYQIMTERPSSIVHRPSSNFWLDRPVFVTGATGLVGGWLVRRLLDAGADVVCLVRDWVPQSELVRGQLLDQVKVVRGDVGDQ